MRSAVIGVLSVMLGAASLPARAAGVYTCRDASGTTIYQGVPCAAEQESVAHRLIEPAPTADEAPAEESSARGSRRASERTTPRRTEARSKRRAAGSERALAYECREGRRTWIQSQPCATRALELSTSSGRRALGSDGEARVSERALRRRELCAKVRDGSHRDPAGTRAADSAYQRNLLRDRGC